MSFDSNDLQELEHKRHMYLVDVLCDEVQHHLLFTLQYIKMMTDYECDPKYEEITYILRDQVPYRCVTFI